jgi:hypothetical protein
MKKLNKFILGALLTVFSVSVLADDKTSTAEVVPSDVGTTYTIKPGYKYFRLNCGRFDYVYTKEYTMSKDKKELTMINDDGEWVQIINTDCKINMVKP